MTTNAVAFEEHRRSPLPYGLPPYVDDQDVFGPEVAGLTHLSPDQGVLELELVDPRMRPPAELPEVTAWTTRYLVTLLEVFTGQRPTQQLLRWSSADIYAGVQRRAGPPRSRTAARSSSQVNGLPVRPRCDPRPRGARD